MEQNVLDLINVSKSYGDNLILDNLSLSVKHSEFLTLLGPSGCGKTTTLRIIGGFEYPDKGKVMFEGREVTDLEPYERKVNTVFQKYALFPHMNVFENIAFGLKIKKMDKLDIVKNVREVLSLVNLKGFENRSISSLSGGQQQRVAIARALVNKPTLLLLDEPLGALDLKLRKDMQVELKKLQQATEITFIYVTHDQEEALTMSDKVVILNEGVIQQIGSPTDVYNEPVNAFVADFIGESNILPGIMRGDYLVEFEGAEFKCVDKDFEKEADVEVVIRPEDVELVSPDDGILTGFVTSVVFKGVHYEMIVDINGADWIVQSTVKRDVDQEVGIYVLPDNIHVMKSGGSI